MANLSAWAQSHKPQLAIGGVGAAALLGLVSARKRKTASPAGATAGGTYSGPIQGGDPYGMTNDVVNSITPQLQALQQAITAIGAQTGNPTPGMSADPYSVGQAVGPNETIVQSLWDPVMNTFINLTSAGGVYTSTPMALPGEGSFLGSAAKRFKDPNAMASELALHGQFAQGGLTLLPGGGYTLTNTHGEKYVFGK